MSTAVLFEAMPADVLGIETGSQAFIARRTGARVGDFVAVEPETVTQLVRIDELETA